MFRHLAGLGASVTQFPHLENVLTPPGKFRLKCMAGDGQMRDLKLPVFTAQLGWPWSTGTYPDSSPSLSRDISVHVDSAPGLWLPR